MTSFIYSGILIILEGVKHYDVIMMSYLQVSRVNESNTTLEESVGTLVHTCDQLSDELENSREEVEDLEGRCKLEKEEVGKVLPLMYNVYGHIEAAFVSTDLYQNNVSYAITI